MNKLRKLLMGKEAVQALEKMKLQEKANTPSSGGMSMFSPLQVDTRYNFVNGRIIAPADKKQAYILKGYIFNDIVYGGINLVTDKVRLPDWNLFKVVDEQKAAKVRRLTKRLSVNTSIKEYKDLLKLKEQALEPIENFDLRTGKLAELLKYPNETESFPSQVADGAAFKMITGDMYLWGDRLKAGANEGIPNTLRLLPADKILISATMNFPSVAQLYQILEWNQTFIPEDVLHEKYYNPEWNINGQQLYGLSPVKAFYRKLTRNNMAVDSSTAKLENGGLDSIIYFDDQRFDGVQGLEQVAALKNQLNQEYTGPVNQGKKAVSGYKVGAVNLGLSPVELAIIDSEKWDAISFLNVIGVPAEIFGLVAKTYNNVREAEKALTTRSAIPLLSARRDSFNRKLQTDWGFKGKNIFVDYNLDVFSELESNSKETMEYLERVTAVRPNEERELVGLDSDPDPLMDELWIRNGAGVRIPLSDFQMNQVDQTLEDDTAAIAATGSQNGNGKISANGNGKARVQN